MIKCLVDNKFFDLSLTPTATTSATDFPILNLRQHSRSFVWRSTSDDDQRITLDLGVTPPAIDSFVMLFDLMNDIQLTSGATVKLQANATAEWTTPSVDETISINRTFKVGTKFFTSDKTYRYWSIFIDDSSNPDGYVQVDKLFLCKAATISQDPEIGFSENIVDRSARRENDYGHQYWDIYPQVREMKFNWSMISETDRQTLKAIYRSVGTHTPIILAIDTAESMFTDHEEFVIYGRITSSFGLEHRVFNYFDYSIELSEVV